MSDSGYIIQFEIPPFAEEVEKLPKEMAKGVYTAVSNTIVDTVNAVVLSKGSEVVIPELVACVPKEYAVQVALSLQKGTGLCEKIAQCVRSSSNPEEDYRRIMLNYLRCCVDEVVLGKSSFAQEGNS